MDIGFFNTLADCPSGRRDPANRRRIQPDRFHSGLERMCTMVQSKSRDTTARTRREIDAHLKASPPPQSEWPRLLAIFDRYELGHLLNLAPSSVARYAAGDRRTPEAVGRRVNALTRIVGDLAASHDEIALRRWFDRASPALGGRAPAQVLQGDWQPDDPGPRRVCELAGAPATPPMS